MCFIFQNIDTFVMGANALDSHVKGKKHIDLVKAKTFKFRKESKTTECANDRCHDSNSKP